MALAQVATAIERAKRALERRPGMGLHGDAPALARWVSDTRIVASHANGTEVATDMPGELGGTGDKVSPGWLFRAGFASCAATTIALLAATEGIDLAVLEIEASSRSDTRGVLGMTEAAGAKVRAGPTDVRLRVRIAARGATDERLRALVEEGLRRSPVPDAVRSAVPVALQVDVEAA